MFKDNVTRRRFQNKTNFKKDEESSSTGWWSLQLRHGKIFLALFNMELLQSINKYRIWYIINKLKSSIQQKNIFLMNSSNRCENIEKMTKYYLNR